MARRGRAIPKSDFSASAVISETWTMVSVSRVFRTVARLTWMVASTTRSWSHSSIITGGVGDLARAARYSVWPG